MPSPLNFFFKLQQIQRSFVWANKKPRIYFQLITRSKASGGMGFPDFKRYYYATIITRVIDWSCHPHNKDWVNREISYTKLTLGLTPWISKSYHPKQLLEHSLIANTLEIFHIISKMFHLANITDPLTPMFNNPEFPQGLNNPTHLYKDSNKPLMIKHCLHNGTMKSKEDL